MDCKPMKTTAAHFKLFKTECERWIKKLGLISWEVGYVHKKLDGYRAQIIPDYKSRIVTVIFSTEYVPSGDSLTEDIKSTALHEVLELLLFPLGAHALDRSWSPNDYEKDNHTIIRTLEVLLAGGRK